MSNAPPNGPECDIYTAFNNLMAVLTEIDVLIPKDLGVFSGVDVATHKANRIKWLWENSVTCTL